MASRWYNVNSHDRSGSTFAVPSRSRERPVSAARYGRSPCSLQLQHDRFHLGNTLRVAFGEASRLGPTRSRPFARWLLRDPTAGVALLKPTGMAGDAFQIAPTVKRPPGTRRRPTISCPRSRMMVPTAQPINFLAASNPCRSQLRRGSSSGLRRETSAVTAGKPSRENARYSKYRAGSLMMAASRCPRGVRA